MQIHQSAEDYLETILMYSAPGRNYEVGMQLRF